MRGDPGYSGSRGRVTQTHHSAVATAIHISTSTRAILRDSLTEEQ